MLRSYSGQLTQAQCQAQRYSQLDKEGLALMFGGEHFHQYLCGRNFEAVTGHKPLLGLPGLDKAVPVQVLARSAVSHVTSCDPVLPQGVKAASGGVELVQQTYYHKTAELSLQQGCLLWVSRVAMPQSLRSRVLQLQHAGHLGVAKTKIAARSNRPWSRLHADLEVPCNGHYFLVVVDAVDDGGSTSHHHQQSRPLQRYDRSSPPRRCRTPSCPTMVLLSQAQST
ncbi:uncharacterized protein LOC142578339 [Dermacentor variabilis]|uniref:uncharacterized protein LOC142578339 n=1 Tax=Dermacentor variabilis TaxID=34621 RepID=UPI003F5B51F6